MRDLITRLTPRRRGERQIDAATLEERLAGLSLATRVARGRVADDAVDSAAEVLAVAAARREFATDQTVVALAGATGAGKSSILNAIVGEPVARAGVLRPTTGEPLAAVWQPGPGVAPLLDWLGVPRWHVVEASGSPPDAAAAAGQALGGLVLVDLPDHDSTQTSHREHVDRLVERVDMMIWVMDPQKYADAVVHDQYLARFARHAEVTVVLLNQADRLPPDELESCVAHLRELLTTDGLGAARVWATSATSGLGLDQLRQLLAATVVEKRAAMLRTAADVAAAADRLASASGDTGATLPVISRQAADQLSDKLAHAAGVELVTAAVSDSVRRSGTAATGWPATRWLSRLRPDPLADLRLSKPGVAPELIATTMPSTDPVALASASAAIRDYANKASAGAPPGWVRSTRAVASQTVHDLVPELDRTIAAAQVAAPRPPLWWKLVGALQWLFLAVGAAGAAWLLGLLAMGALALPRPVPPSVGGLPAPTVMLVGGLLIGIVLAGLAGIANRRTATRAARAAGRDITAAVGELVRVRVTEPIGAELATLEDFRVGLLAARGDG